jgi:hypothetical protein
MNVSLDAREASMLALVHRQRQRPFEEPSLDPEPLNQALQDFERNHTTTLPLTLVAPGARMAWGICPMPPWSQRCTLIAAALKLSDGRTTMETGALDLQIQLRHQFAEGLDRLLAVTADLSDEALATRHGRTAPSVGFHLWHVARWMDYYQDALTGPGCELWEREGFARAWGLDRETQDLAETFGFRRNLGYAGTGMGMSDEESEALSLPGGDELGRYARRVFTVAQEVVQDLSSDDLAATYTGHRSQEWAATSWGRPSVGAALLTQTVHTNRHLGMVEALRGLLGLHGTATR